MRINYICVGDVCVDHSHVSASPGLAVVYAMGRPAGSLQCFNVDPCLKNMDLLSQRLLRQGSMSHR